MYGIAGVLGLISVLAYYNMSYKEITWKDFVNKYVPTFYVKHFIWPKINKFNYILLYVCLINLSYF